MLCIESDSFRLSQKSDSKRDVENQLAKNVKDRFVPSSVQGVSTNRASYLSTKIAMEAQHGLIAQVIKDILFSSRPGQTSQPIASIEETVEMAIG
jgi:COP9 signalosome complex subunit 5